MPNDVAVKQAAAGLPAYLQGKVKTAKIGNIDETDVKVPRVKLMQAISPEVETYENAKPGVFWHTQASESMGTVLSFIPVLVRKTYMLWSPRHDPRGILARSNDGVHWDVKEVFTVKPKGSTKDIFWDTTSGSVALSGLDQFGTSDPGNQKSAPAASLTYQFLMWFPDMEELSPAIVLNTRSAVNPAQDLLGKIQLRKQDHYAQRFRMEVAKEQGAEGPYYNYRYFPDGYATEEQYNLCKELYERYSAISFSPTDEGEERSEAGATSSKF